MPTPTSRTPRRGLIFHARPARVDGRRYYAAPTLHQPLSHGAKRRDSSPFRGAEGVCASACHGADTCVPLTPVRGGVLDAPRSRDCRGGLDADVGRGRWHPRHPRRARLSPPPNVLYPVGTARAPFCTDVRRRPSTHAGRARKVSPYGAGGEHVGRAKRTGLRTGPFSFSGAPVFTRPARRCCAP